MEMKEKRKEQEAKEKKQENKKRRTTTIHGISGNVYENIDANHKIKLAKNNIQ